MNTTMGNYIMIIYGFVSRYFQIVLGCVLFVLICPACKQPYLPPVAKSNLGYLVVDGIIINGQDSTIITLSRTENITDTVYVPIPETGALVTVVGQSNDSYVLNEQPGGRYVTDQLSLNNAETYQLKIITSNGKQYLSDPVPVKQTPPIDSIYWRQDSLGVSLSLSTHDPSNNTKYYRWDYTETWIYHSSEESIADWTNNQIVLRDSTTQIYNCWGSDMSTVILIASSANLSQDVINLFPLTTIPHGSEKLNFLYSILVNQYAITSDEYDYLQTTKSYTEELGGLFDPQPSQIEGNIHCLTNPAEPVLGFINVSSLSSSRIFISYRSILPGWGYVPYYSTDSCVNTFIPYSDLNTYLPPTGPRNYVFIGQTTIGNLYIVAPIFCGDCRIHGGTNIKPSFWP
jgi:hypothetical protein